MVKTHEIREMNAQERAAKLVECKEEWSRQRGQVESGTRADNPGKMRPLRKTIARIYTIESEQKSRQEKEVRKKE